MKASASAVAMLAQTGDSAAPSHDSVIVPVIADEVDVSFLSAVSRESRCP